MQNNFLASLALVLKSEGGYVNNPHDKGGATNFGITQAVDNVWRERLKEPLINVKIITASEVAAIYKRNYWDVEKCGDLPAGLDYAVFDWAVNSGDLRAETAIQLAMKTHPNISGHSLIDLYMDERLAFLKGLSDWKFFGGGWSNRIVFVRKQAHIMASKASLQTTQSVISSPTSIQLKTGIQVMQTVLNKNALNIASLLAMAAPLSAAIPYLYPIFGNYGIVGAGVFLAGFAVQAFWPTDTVTKIESAVVSELPTLETLAPASIRPLLNDILGGLQALQATQAQAQTSVTVKVPPNPPQI